VKKTLKNILKYKTQIVLFFFSAILALSFFVYWKKPKRYNILIVSTCSLAHSRLPVFSKKAQTGLKNIENYLSHSFVITNAFNDMSWSNVSGFLSELNKDDLKKNNYKAIGNPWTDSEKSWQKLNNKNTPEYYFRYPNSEYSWRSEATNYFEDIQKINKKINDKENWPFLLEIHNKYLHLPYVKQNEYSELGHLDQEYILEYLNNLEKYPDRILFSMFFYNDTDEYKTKIIKILKLNKTSEALLRFSGRKPTFVGFVNNKKLLSAWQKSKYFTKDLEIVKKLYDIQLKKFDRMPMKEILSLYNNKELMDNTVIIFTGDHGEAFNEHGFFIHGETVYDEMLRFPLAIKFPNQKRQIILDKQFHQFGILNIVKEIINGKLTEKNFTNYIKSSSQDFIYSRNCSYLSRSLRYKNQWKYIENLTNDSRELYNLINDPNEKVNVIDSNPEIYTFLEGSIEFYKKQQKMNKMIHTCVE